MFIVKMENLFTINPPNLFKGMEFVGIKVKHILWGTGTGTDPRLLAKTGGIVQGMSGSPILQNGKLIGAVTHVMIGDPTSGYGIFIENMLNQMN